MNTNALAKEVLKAPRTKKTVTLVKEEVVMADGSQFVPMDVKNSSDVLRASLLMLFKHVSDIHVSLVEIVADKFGLNIEDIHKAIQDDPRWAQMFVNPLITDLTATAKEHSVPKKQRKPRTKKVAAPAPVPVAVAVVVSSTDDEELVFNDDDELVFD
jgi:hypothetical protein